MNTTQQSIASQYGGRLPEKRALIAQGAEPRRRRHDNADKYEELKAFVYKRDTRGFTHFFDKDEIEWSKRIIANRINVFPKIVSDRKDVFINLCLLQKRRCCSTGCST